MIVLLRRVELYIASGLLPVQYVSLLPHLLLGSLRMQFSLAWPPVRQALDCLARQYADVAWGPVYQCLQASLAPSVEPTLLPRRGYELDAGKVSFLHFVDSQRTVETPQQQSKYHELVWLAVQEGIALGPQMARNQRQLVPVFLAWVRNTYDAVFADLNLSLSLEAVDPAASPDVNQSATKEGRHAAHQKLLWVLRAFKQWLRTPQHLQQPHRTQYLRLLIRLLSHPDPSLQRLSVECLVAWRLAFFNPYVDSLLRLIDDNSFREEMTAFHIGSVRGVVFVCVAGGC